MRASLIPQVSLAARVIATVVTFVLLDTLLTRVMVLPGETYRQPVLMLGAVRHLGWVIAAVLAAGAALALVFGHLRSPWSRLDHGQALRWFVVFLAAMAAWPFLTHGYNHFYDQAWLADRALLATTLVLIAWRPVFVLPFLFLLYPLMGQIVEPALGGTVLAHKLQLTRAIGVFAAAFLIHAVSGERRSDHFAVVVCCLVAAAYWLPALAKLRLDWLTGDHLAAVPLAAFAHGWLGQFEPAQLVSFARTLDVVDPFMRVAVIVIEAGCLLFLFRRRLALVLLTCVIVFHLGVFALFGFLFWTWIALDAALFVLLLRRPHLLDWHSGTLLRMTLSVALILGASWWAKPPLLGWYDTPLSYHYRVFAETDDGATHRLHPRFFAPYEDVFTMASFSYIMKEHAVLVGPYGVTHRDDLNVALDRAGDAQAVFGLEAQEEIRHNPDRTAAFVAFLERFVNTRNERGDPGMALYALHPPRQFWSHVDGLDRLDGRRVRALEVREVTWFFDGESLREIRDIPVLSIALDEAGGAQ